MREFALGTARLNDSNEALKLLHLYAERGGRLLDTAVVYEAASSLLARALATPVFRDVTVAVKVCHPPLCSPANISQEVDRARAAIRRDVIPLLVLHRDNPLYSVDEWAEALARQVETGCVAAVGLSNWTPQRTAAIRSLVPISWVDAQYSLLIPRKALWDGTRSFHPVEFNDLLATTRYVAAWSPLSGIASLRRDPNDAMWASPGNRALLSRCEDLAAGYGCDATDIALAWLQWTQPRIVPIVGPTRLAHLDQLGRFDVDAEELASLSSLSCASD